MGEETLFNLRWDAQRTAILSSVSEIFQEESFVDITIVSEGQIFKAHRLILAASSPYLKQALLSVPSEHAVLLLPHVSSSDLANILKFIYEGEIKMNQKALKSFLQVSKLLKIKGMDFDVSDISEVSSIPPKRNSPARPDPEDDSNKRMKLSSSSPSNTTIPIPSAAATAAAAKNIIANAIVLDSHEHIPSSTADFQIHGYGGRGGGGNATTCDREDLDMDDPDLKSDEHLDYEKELISLDDEEEDEQEMGGSEEYEGGDGEMEDEDYKFQPEVSFLEGGNWSAMAAHSSTSMGSSPMGMGRHRSLKRPMGSSSATSTHGSISEGILQRMMREPLKSSVGSSPSMSISLSHGIPQGHGGHGHGHSPYDLHDNIGLRKQTKRYVQCSSCSKVLSSLSALKRHMEDVHCARIQGKCIICGRVYSSRNSLLTHVYSAHKKHHDYKAVARIIRESDFEQFANV